MVEFLNTLLPIVLYIVAIAALIVVIILGIKMIKVVDKADKVVDNIEEKVNSLNLAFEVIDKTTESIVGIGNTIVSTVTGLLSRFGSKKNILEEDEDYE